MLKKKKIYERNSRMKLINYIVCNQQNKKEKLINLVSIQFHLLHLRKLQIIFNNKKKMIKKLKTKFQNYSNKKKFNYLI